MQQPDAKMQARILKFANPTFGYRRGGDGEIEKEIFDGEPLPEGWVDSPAKVDKAVDGSHLAAAVTQAWFGEQNDPPVPVLEDEEVEPTPDDSALSRPYADHKFNDLKSALKRRTGKGPKAGTNKVAVIEMLEALDAAAVNP
jgi:hypothetical protein